MYNVGLCMRAFMYFEGNVRTRQIIFINNSAKINGKRVEWSLDPYAKAVRL